MAESRKEQLVIAISSRALFDLDASHEVFERKGLEAYSRYQIEREDEPLQPGRGFQLVRKLLDINKLLECDERPVEVVLASRNSADTGLRVFNSIEHHELSIKRAAFCGGESPYSYLGAFGVKLFLSAEPDDVQRALAAGIPAATLVSRQHADSDGEQVRFAFDGDAVLFADDAERIFQREGEKRFEDSEKAAAREPLSGGPFKPCLAALQSLQRQFPPGESPIRTALVTARSAPAHERVIRTLREWKIRIDEAIFLGGLDKGEFLKSYRADVFFDDRQFNCESAAEHVTTGHVPHGVANQRAAPAVGHRD